MKSGGREIGRFEFATVASLRTMQLMRGCTPRVGHSGKLTTTAQREVAEGRVEGISRAGHPPVPPAVAAD
jgi:DNA-directed RNA polymerase subunit K/omega